MRESDNSENVLRCYESPAMRVVPLEGGRIVVGSLYGDTGSLGAFGGGDVLTDWSNGSVNSGLGLGVFDGGDVLTDWSNGSVSSGLGVFDGGDGLADWSNGSVNSGLGLFTGGDAGLDWGGSPDGNPLPGFDDSGDGPVIWDGDGGQAR